MSVDESVSFKDKNGTFHCSCKVSNKFGYTIIDDSSFRCLACGKVSNNVKTESYFLSCGKEEFIYPDIAINDIVLINYGGGYGSTVKAKIVNIRKHFCRENCSVKNIAHIYLEYNNVIIDCSICSSMGQSIKLLDKHHQEHNNVTIDKTFNKFESIIER
jgi:hypothetical protein